MDSDQLSQTWTLLCWLVVYGIGLFAAWHALNNKRHSSSALGWIAISLLVPLIGPGLYYILGINRVEPSDAKSRRPRPDRTTRPNVARKIPQQFHGLVHLGDALTGWPAVTGNRVTPLHNGEQAFSDMITSIKNAKREVLLSTYIFETNKIGHEFIKALAMAKGAGANTCLLVDGVGEYYSRPRISQLADKFGLVIRKFHPPALLPPNLHLNLRNHRKILVVDNTVAYTGGMNIGDRYLESPGPGSKGCQDTQFKCEGPIASGIRRIFANDWRTVTGSSLDQQDAAQEHDSMICRVIADGPGRNLLKLQLVIQAAINAANHRIAIMTPYFVPPDEIICALQSAALRGLRIDLLIPEKSNLPYVSWATRHMIQRLTNYGVNVSLQPPPFPHDKLLLIDQHYALVGSANLDYRSLRLNFEIGLEVFSDELGQSLQNDFDRRLALSTPLDPEEIDARGWHVRTRDGLAWLAAPYL